MRPLPLLALLIPACLPALPGDPPKPGGDESGVTDTGAADTGAADTGAADTGAADTGDSGEGAAGTAPEVLGVTLAPEQPRVTDTLVAHATVRDVDGDLSVVGATWTLNGADMPDGTVIAETVGTDGGAWAATFPGMARARRGDSIEVVVVAIDDAGNTVVSTETTTRVLNSEPVAPTPEVSPATPDQDTELTCLSLEPTDADGDTLSTTWAWYADGAPIAGQEGTTLAAGTVPHGTDVSCETRVSDGAGGIVQATSATVRVVDRMPSLGSVTLDPVDPRPGDPLLCMPHDVEDLDGDPIVAEYTFTAGGQSVRLTGDETGMEMPWSVLSARRGDTITCTVELYADDIAVADATSEPATVANTPPTARALTLTSSDAAGFRVGADLSCALTGLADDDGDDVTGAETCACVVTDARDGDTPFVPAEDSVPAAGALTCTAAAFDGTDYGTLQTARGVVTWSPVVTSAVFAPVPITATSGLWLETTVDDPDSSSVTLSFDWYRKAPAGGSWVLVQSGSADSLDTSATPLTAGASYYVRVTPSDELGAGPTWQTNPVTVLDTVAPAPVVDLRFGATSGTTNLVRDLVCTAEALDPDGDTVHLHAAWERDGTPYSPDAGAVTTQAADGPRATIESTLRGDRTQVGEIWTCKVWSTNNATLTTDPATDPMGWTGPGQDTLDVWYAGCADFSMSPSGINDLLPPYYGGKFKDIDKDGDLDLLTHRSGDPNGGTRLFRWNTDRFDLLWTEPDGYVCLTGWDFADFNGDGYYGVAMSSCDGVGGGYSGRARGYDNVNGAMSTTPDWNAQNSWALGLATGDYNHDGYSDVAVFNHSAMPLNAALYINAAGVLPSLPTWTATHVASAGAFGDVDGDGHDELLTCHESQPARLYRIGASGYVSLLWTASGSGDTHCVFADVDADSDLDVVTVSHNDGSRGLRVYVNDAGGFNPDPTLLLRNVTGGPLVAGDLNADGRDDLALGVSGGMAIYRNRTAGGVVRLELARTHTYGGPTQILDVDGNGYGDIVANDVNGTAVLAGRCDDGCDEDNDGYRAVTCGGTDCDDRNDVVHPGQTAYFTSPTRAGDYDYDCDGTDTAAYTRQAFCTLSSLSVLPGNEGWTSLPAPACGQSGEWSAGDEGCNQFFNLVATSTVTQACR